MNLEQNYILYDKMHLISENFVDDEINFDFFFLCVQWSVNRNVKDSTSNERVILFIVNNKSEAESAVSIEVVIGDMTLSRQTTSPVDPTNKNLFQINQIDQTTAVLMNYRR